MDRRKTHAVKLNYAFDRCYICHRPLTEQDRGESMCPACRRLNTKKREHFLDRRKTMEGTIAIVTGGRIKIGYETGLSLLRKGATVLVTTRFPIDAIMRYSKENDYEEWSEHLMAYGIDFRDIREVEKMIAWIKNKLPHLDILINNAAQTIARPEEYYQYLRMQEEREKTCLPKHEWKCLQNKTVPRTVWKEIAKKLPLPAEVDESGFLLDFRHRNSWTCKAEDISTKEFLEVQLVNVTVPFLLCSRLAGLMRKSPSKNRFIVNVSAMEGRFSKRNKNSFHPHTNMAKAALNMLTRTIAEDYSRMGIYVNSVDTGWITDENPYPIAMRNKEKGFVPPLDFIDGAVRVCDPFLDYYEGKKLEKGKPEYGRFLKDFHPIVW